jgi:hypothetical protein
MVGSLSRCVNFTLNRDALLIVANRSATGRQGAGHRLNTKRRPHLDLAAIAGR